MAIRVQQAAFDPGQELNALHAQNVGIGAVVGFVGSCATSTTVARSAGCSSNIIRA